MNRVEYYELVKTKARELRQLHGLTTAKVTLTDLRSIYRANGIKIDYWPGSFKNVRGQYLFDEDTACVMVAKKLPPEQKIFTLAHELKHHFFDKDESKLFTEKEPIEIAAELFAVELIFPDPAFIQWFIAQGIGKGSCTSETIVRMKHMTETTLSYASLAKRAEFLGFAPKNSLLRSGWHRLRDSIYGEPVYKRVQRIRKAREARSLA